MHIFCNVVSVNFSILDSPPLEEILWITNL
nr:MAG TPA: hypothetical protein [Caudoviricetes sp.]